MKSEFQRWMEKQSELPVYTSGEGETEDLQKALMAAYSYLSLIRTVKTSIIKFRAELADEITDEVVIDAVEKLSDDIRTFLIGGVHARFHKIEVGHDVVERDGVQYRENPHLLASLEVFTFQNS